MNRQGARAFLSKFFATGALAMCCVVLRAAPDPAKPAFKSFLYGTQYYRAPTPLPTEWEGDMQALTDNNIETLQLRLNWRQNEPREDEYVFDDVDRLMDLAEKYDKKVVIKFLLECAPQYIFDKYDGTRIGPKGEKVQPCSIGAFYTGGWLPCFQNPQVVAHAAKFIRTTVERYHARKCLSFWNVWNEPRCRPVEECFCDECRKAYGNYLKAKFGTIGALNAFYGVSEDSFEHIALPGSTKGYWDIFEFKMFKSGPCIYDNLKFVYDAIRVYDGERPIISHVGGTCGFQLQLGDVCNDFVASRAVDGWGTSLPLSTCMGSRQERLEYNRLHDFLRCVDPNYFIYEIYPGLGCFAGQYDSKWDMDYKLYSGLAWGTKGLNFWQYRAERVGSELDCAGLVRADGSPRPPLASVREFGATLKPLKDTICGFYPKRAEVAVVFDYKSLLMSEIMEARHLQGFGLVPDNALFYYPYAHRGWYWLVRGSNRDVDYVNVGDISRIRDYKVVCFPVYMMYDKAITPVLEEYVENGGIVLADEGFGLLQENTWMSPYDIPCGKVMTARLRERRLGARSLTVDGRKLTTSGYNSEYAVRDAKTVLSFDDGTPAVQEVRFGKGRIDLLGFSLGYSITNAAVIATWQPVFDLLTKSAGLSSKAYADFDGGLDERRLFRGDEQYLFLINSSETEKRVRLREKIEKTYAHGHIEADWAFVPSKSALIIKCH